MAAGEQGSTPHYSHAGNMAAGEQGATPGLVMLET